MNKNEVKEILKAVEAYFPGRLKVDDPAAMIVTWHRVLKDYEYEKVIENLDIYAAHNKFAPTVADLIKTQGIERDRYVPGVEETRAYLAEAERKRQEVQNDPEVQTARAEAKAEIERILGIERG